MKIYVTQKHIDAGVRLNCFSCPIALALKDAGFKRPMVDPNFIMAFNQEGECVVNEQTPPKAANFICLFDMPLGKDKVKPFVFTLSSIE